MLTNTLATKLNVTLLKNVVTFCFVLYYNPQTN